MCECVLETAYGQIHNYYSKYYEQIKKTNTHFEVDCNDLPIYGLATAVLWFYEKDVVKIQIHYFFNLYF